MIDWEENRISENVCEFRATRRRRDHLEKILAAIIVVLLITSVVWSAPIYLHICTSIVIIIIIMAHRSFVIEESVLVIRDFGIQLRQKYASGSEFTKFLDRDRIGSVFIHECIRGSSVRYHLAFFSHGETKLSLSFEHVYPGLGALERVYTELSGFGNSQ